MSESKAAAKLGLCQKDTRANWRASIAQNHDSFRGKKNNECDGWPHKDSIE